MLGDHVADWWCDIPAIRSLALSEFYSEATLLRVVPDAWYRYHRIRALMARAPSRRLWLPEGGTALRTPRRTRDRSIPMFWMACCIRWAVRGALPRFRTGARVGIIQDRWHCGNLVEEGRVSVGAAHRRVAVVPTDQHGTEIWRGAGPASCAGFVQPRPAGRQCRPADPKLMRAYWQWIGKHHADLHRCPWRKGLVMVHHIPPFPQRSR